MACLSIAHLLHRLIRQSGFICDLTGALHRVARVVWGSMQYTKEREGERQNSAVNNPRRKRESCVGEREGDGKEEMGRFV